MELQENVLKVSTKDLIIELWVHNLFTCYSCLSANSASVTHTEKVILLLSYALMWFGERCLKM